MILKMFNDKVLQITKNSDNYKGENNAENIKILLPKFFKDCDTRECTIYLNILNQDSAGNVFDVTSSLAEYNDELYQCNLLMSNMFTYKEGNIKLWIEIINSEKDMVAKSSIVCLVVLPHINVEEVIPEQDLSVLEDLTIQIGSLSDEIKSLQENLDSIQAYIDNIRNHTLLAADG